MRGWCADADFKPDFAKDRKYGEFWDFQGENIATQKSIAPLVGVGGPTPVSTARFCVWKRVLYQFRTAAPYANWVSFDSE